MSLNLRLPLYAKILGWFFLNIALAALALLLLAQTQFHFGLDSLLSGRAGDRIQALSRVIVDELNATPAEEWSAILARFENAYGVRLGVFRGDGTQLGGAEMKLPAPVAERLRAGRRPNVNGFFGRPDRPEGPPAEEAPPPPEGREGPRPQPRPAPPREMLRTSDPSLYWVLVRLPLRPPPNQRPQPVTLIAQSASLSGGGLFFDIVPWLSAGAGVLIFSTLLWFPMVRGITRAIAQMNAATGQIAEGRFDVRVPATRRDELGSLALSINDMAGRLEGFVAGQKRFLGDIAHELCTPMARMQMALGILEQRATDPQTVEDVREELQEMSALVNELLSFSKASLGMKQSALTTVVLRPLIETVIEREAPGVPVKMDIPADLTALAVPDLLQRALANLLRNALRYAGDKAEIGISAVEKKEEVWLTVWDNGPGVPEAAREQIFDPFFRLDPSRDRQTGGVGLGLAIVKTCVASCGGSITCGERAGGGAEFLLRLRRA